MVAVLDVSSIEGGLSLFTLVDGAQTFRFTVHLPCLVKRTSLSGPVDDVEIHALHSDNNIRIFYLD